MAMTHRKYRKLATKLDAVASTKKQQPENTEQLDALLNAMFGASGEPDGDSIFGDDNG